MAKKDIKKALPDFLQKENQNALKAVYADEMQIVWKGDQKMVDFCLKQVSVMVKLPSGYFLPIEKRRIEKDFCFGYHCSRYDTESYDDAADMASHAKTSADYFIEENMKAYKQVLDILKGIDTYYRPVLQDHYHQKGSPESKELTFMREYEIIDAHGGSVYLEDLPGSTFCRYGVNYYIPTAEEVEMIISAYEYAATLHEKKVQAYLKRYGMEKVNTWTYWLDA